MKYKMLLAAMCAICSGSCEKKPVSSRNPEKIPKDPITISNLKEGEGIMFEPDKELDASLGIFRSKGEITFFQKQGKSTPFASPFIVTIKGENEVSFVTTRYGKLEGKESIGSVRYYDVNGDGLPEFKKDSTGIYKIQRIEWSKGDGHDLTEEIRKNFPSEIIEDDGKERGQ